MQPRQTIVVASILTLRRASYYRRLWIAARSMNISRRAFLDALSIAVARHGGSLVDDQGMVFEMPDIDLVFADDEGRWLSYYLEAAIDGGPRRIARRWNRVQLIDLYFRLKHPQIAKHFDR